MTQQKNDDKIDTVNESIPDILDNISFSTPIYTAEQIDKKVLNNFKNFLPLSGGTISDELIIDGLFGVNGGEVYFDTTDGLEGIYVGNDSLKTILDNTITSAVDASKSNLDDVYKVKGTKSVSELNELLSQHKVTTGDVYNISYIDDTKLSGSNFSGKLRKGDNVVWVHDYDHSHNAYHGYWDKLTNDDLDQAEIEIEKKADPDKDAKVTAKWGKQIYGQLEFDLIYDDIYVDPDDPLYNETETREIGRVRFYTDTTRQRTANPIFETNTVIDDDYLDFSALPDIYVSNTADKSSMSAFTYDGIMSASKGTHYDYSYSTENNVCKFKFKFYFTNGNDNVTRATLSLDFDLKYAEDNQNVILEMTKAAGDAYGKPITKFETQHQFRIANVKQVIRSFDEFATKNDVKNVKPEVDLTEIKTILNTLNSELAKI